MKDAETLWDPGQITLAVDGYVQSLVVSKKTGEAGCKAALCNRTFWDNETAGSSVFSLCGIVVTSHVPLERLKCSNMTEALNFKFYVILIHLNEISTATRGFGYHNRCFSSRRC